MEHLAGRYSALTMLLVEITERMLMPSADIGILMVRCG